LLNDFTIWRQILSKNILIYNKDKNFTEEELDEVVQRILDRLIFIRKCEDNGLEDNIMKTKLREWEETRSKGFYTYLQGIFRYFDENYDSELFRRHSCDDVIITNDVLREIVSGLYETKDKMISYDFSVIDADVLGSVYEQYLGHILKKSEKRAKVTENYVYKKKEGIYYTPIYVVDYIVRNTLGELLKDKKVNPEKIRILDPTCGSGSFLIKAFDVLNEHYSKSKIYDQTTLDTKTLTTFKTKERILINNIFGVDLDKKAVEIAQLNLLLKIAEKGHRLPLLKQNIKCGNSFIDDVTLVGDKAFSWETEFKFILDAGGFDITIGNPPYVHQKGEKDSPLINFKEREYYRKNYESILGKNGKTRGGVKINLFIPYVERCIKLLKEQGKIGFIVHKNILKVESYKFLRRFMLKNCAIETIVDLGGGVFKDVTGETIIMILRKESNPEKRKKNTISIIYGLSSESDLLKGDYSRNEIKQQFFETAPDNMFTIYMDKGINDIKTKMWKGSVKLEDLVSIVSFGLNTVDNKKYFVGQKLNDKYKKAVMGRDIGRWVIKNKNKFVCYDNKVLTRIGDEKSFLAKEKLIMQRIGAGLVCAYDDEQYYCYNSTNMILQKEQRFNLKYILALLNSKLLNTYYRILFATKADLTVNVTQGYLSQLPIRTISESQQQPLIKLVDKMLSLNKRLNKIGDKKTDERTKIEEEIKKTDAEIDEIVYKIYGMNEKEKKIIEGGLE
jgi:type I restriction-modification system DNA methylase subunit